MRLILIRHADPDYPNDTLTPKGHEQAELLGKAMEGTKIDELFVSPMGRAQLTAQYILRNSTLKPVILPWLHELNGNYTGEWAMNYHGCDLHEQKVDWSVDSWREHVPYGEHMTKISKEFYSHFDDFMKENGYIPEGNRYRVTNDNNPTIVFVCHAGVIATLLSKLLHVPLPDAYSHLEISPSGVTELSPERKGDYMIWRMAVLNDMSHARDLRTAVRQTGRFETRHASA